MYASTLGLANLKRIVPRLGEWVNEDGETYDTLTELYGQVVGQWGRYLGHVGRNVGGVRIDPKMTDEAGPVYDPVDAERQRAAVAFLLAEGFTTPDWLLDADLLTRIEPAGAADRVQRLQESALNRLLDPIRIGRMLEAEWLGEGDVYTAAEMMDDLQAGLWSEIRRGASIDPTRRVLQRAYVDRLGEILTEDVANVPTQFRQVAYGYRPLSIDRSDARPYARGALLELQDDVAAALRRYRGPAMRAERYHLLDVAARVDAILNPEG